MPWEIVERGKEICVVQKDNKEEVMCYIGDDAEEKAKRLVAALYANEPEAAGKATGNEEKPRVCECLKCGHTVTVKADEHCADIKCPECGGEMRRKERPGPGKATDGEREKAREAQEARAKKYGIAAKKGKPITKPSEYANVPDASFGDPTNYAYPCDAEHAKAALSYFNQEGQREDGGYTSEEWGIIGRRLAKLLSKHLEASYEYRDGKLAHKEKKEKTFDFAVKALGETKDAWIVGGYGIVWGNEQQRDLSPWPNRDGTRGEFFTPNTAALDDIPIKAMTFEHDKDTDEQGQPIKEALGHTILERDDLRGRWIEAQIEKGRRYAQYVMDLLAQGKLYLSSETASHWREVADNGEIKRWRTAGYTFTTHPMEPRIGEIAALKSYFAGANLDFPDDDDGDDGEGSAGALGQDAEVEKAKALVELELELVELARR